MKHITIVDRKQYSEEGWELLVSVCKEDDLIIDMDDFYEFFTSLTNEDRNALETKMVELKKDPKLM